MKILVTGASGFLGRNLCESLNNIKQNRDKTHPNVYIEQVYEYDVTSTSEELEQWCKEADFVFNFAGINRAKEKDEFMDGNFGFANKLFETLKKYGNKAPVMLSSSIQATLLGRYSGSEYGKSKLASEELFFKYGEEAGVKVLVYRFPNVFGKWCKPNYNSAIATFCNNIANDLPISISDKSVELELLYIDDLVKELIEVLKGKEHHCEYQGLDVIKKENGKYCYVPNTYKVTLGRIVSLLEQFKNRDDRFFIPEIENNSFEKKLYSTYLSYLPKDKMVFPLRMNVDSRGSFTEVLRTERCGQVSVNVSKPGIVKGEHWHHSKWEVFIVVSGHALIQERKIGTDKVIEFEVSGEKMEVVYMLPGYTHNIINLSSTQDLVTLIWANENFNSEYPDTFVEKVIKMEE